jgi:hypothetical protein
VTDADIRSAGIAYMIDLAMERDGQGKIKPEARRLMDRTAAMLNDPAEMKTLRNKLLAEGHGPMATKALRRLLGRAR